MATSSGAFDSARDTYDMVKEVGLEVGNKELIDLLQKAFLSSDALLSKEWMNISWGMMCFNDVFQRVNEENIFKCSVYVD